MELARAAVTGEVIKRIFREGGADVLLCTDAAAEGLNFQFCGAVINYEMPWNPMRVEQRIGRIDRLSQSFPTIQIINLYYADTIETDVYPKLRERIGLFSKYVGRLQPIQAALPRIFAKATLGGLTENQQERSGIVRQPEFRICPCRTCERVGVPRLASAISVRRARGRWKTG